MKDITERAELNEGKRPRANRSLDLIADFVDGYASGWSFAIPEAFKDSLDIRLTQRVVHVLDVNVRKVKVPAFDKNGLPIMGKDGKQKLKPKTRVVHSWTQGKDFNFIEGSVLYDTRLAYELKWLDALRQIKLFVRVSGLTPPSELSFKLFRPSKDFSKVEELETIRCSQENFVDFLRTGAVVTTDGLTRKLYEEYYGEILVPECCHCGKQGGSLQLSASGLCAPCLEEAEYQAMTNTASLKEGRAEREKFCDTIDRAEEEDAIRRIEPSLELSPFSVWDISVHLADGQYDRILRSKRVTIANYNSRSQSADVRSSKGSIYATTFNSCTCRDFISRHLPCKHMYKLASQYGGLDLSHIYRKK